MSLNNLAKTILVTVIIYIIAFMAVVWAPWPPSPNFTSVLDDLRRDQKIGAAIYQILVMVLVMFNWNWHRLTFSLMEFLSILVLTFAPLGILQYYGMENLFVLPWSVLQIIATATLFYIIFKIKNERRPHVPA